MLFYFWDGVKKFLILFIKNNHALAVWALKFNMFIRSQDLHFWNIFSNDYRTSFLGTIIFCLFLQSAFANILQDRYLVLINSSRMFLNIGDTFVKYRH